MRILVINALSALRGGGQTYLINLLSNLSKGDYEVICVVARANEAVFKPYAGDKVKLYVAEWASKSVIHRCIWETFRLPGMLKEWKATTYYAPGGVMTTIAPKGCLSATALRNMLPFDDAERKRFPLFSYSRFKLWLLSSAYKISYRLADRVVFISSYSMGEAEKKVPGVSQKGRVIPHGLNKDFLEREMATDLPKGLKAGCFYLYVSILDVYKAQKEVVTSWKELKAKGFEYPLVLVGPKYNQYGEELVEMISELGLEDDVIYLGAKPYEELPGLYKAARALIFASSCECCPNILLEKLAAGVPVLCSDILPMPEFGGDAAKYFNPYTEGSLVEQVMHLEAEGELGMWGEKAYQQALKFDWEQTSKKTFDFLMKPAKK